jgi:hypothetical protein
MAQGLHDPLIVAPARRPSSDRTRRQARRILAPLRKELALPVAIFRLTPTDYDHWHDVHVRAVRQYQNELSLISDSIYRDHDDPRVAMVLMEIESIEMFQTFTASETFAGLVAEAKLEGDPIFWVLDKAEEVDLDAG